MENEQRWRTNSGAEVVAPLTVREACAMVWKMSPDASESIDSRLATFIERAGGVAGTVHRLKENLLVLEASVNIPPPVQHVTKTIPRGKGMAGLAWERDQPVQTCNLKEDSSGDVRPGAQAVHAKGAVAIPVKDAEGVFLGVVGVAYADERTLDETTVIELTRSVVEYHLL